MEMEQQPTAQARAEPWAAGRRAEAKDLSDTIAIVLAITIAPLGLFYWSDQFLAKLVTGLAITLAVSLALYGVIRAIGWVIGGFAA
jgi:hypothetical protein